MCGICGFQGQGERRHLLAMTRALSHRGPDGEGFFEYPEDRLFLGHRRLAILDVAAGVQPMANADGTVQVVFNGEIYNHGLLRRELESMGYRFRSHHSDTEVLVHGYQAWGENLPQRLNGMFAFAIHDRRGRKVFMARDRFGKKPLYYVHQPGFFAFASEIRSLLQHPGVPDDLDAEAIRGFFAYCFFPAPSTPFRAIRKLPGGQCLVYDMSRFTLEIRPYWGFHVTPDPELSHADGDRLAEELLGLLENAVNRRLESDVPLGFLLSGGVDSSAILALAARTLPVDRLHTFSIGFAEASFDESAHARFMAQTAGSRHWERSCTLNDARIDLPALLERWDEPLGDGSILPTYMVCRFARERVTVALTGDGGDEMFAGYDPFQALHPSGYFNRWVPGWLRSALYVLSLKLPISERNMGLDFKIRSWLKGVRHAPAYWNPVWMGALSQEDLSLLFGRPAPLDEVYAQALTAWESCPSPNIVDRSLEYFTRFYLQDDILTKADRCSMMVGMELRSPFLDNDVAAFAARLPHDLKIRRGQQKWILKKALAGVVPQSILQRPKKGFGIPLARWLKELPMPEAGREAEVMNIGWLRQLWQEHREGQRDARHALWCWMTLNTFLSGIPSRSGGQTGQVRDL
ncbi:MAG: asparagine synthase (glutamine-hydrolyzing) [Magnetococcales bacterium]|nr:asparagine synthase (glutamine-hydrolyzing) [Magnetococcales bacterium]